MTHHETSSRIRYWGTRGALALAAVLAASSASAAPEAHVLRIDPRASLESGVPVLTTVIEVSQIKRVSDAIADCATMTGNAQFDCMSQNLEKELALYTPFPFPKDNALLTVTVDGVDQPAKFISEASWGESQQQPGVGTAWLILIDADKRMGKGFEDAKTLAGKFVAAMGPNDIVNVMFLNDRQVVKDSKWLPAASKSTAQTFVTSVTDLYPNSGRNRTLLDIIKTAATDGWKSLGNAGDNVKVPLHQAMVVLSSGYGGADPMTSGPGGAQISKYMSEGRFPEDNTSQPKSPVPVISVYYPPNVYDEYRTQSLGFMQNMANPEIGGFFTVMRDGQGSRSDQIVRTVRTRFSKMHVVKWRVACIAPTVEQTFKLNFNNVKPPILGDSSFKNVPVGIDPTTWPLDVNIQYTQDEAKRVGGVEVGSSDFKLYGDFCWGGSKERAEIYFLPAGQQAPAALSGADVDKAKRLQQQLIAQGMKGEPLESSSTYVRFKVPDKDKILHGSGDAAVVRIVLVDNYARRSTGVTADTILTLKAQPARFPLLYLLGGLFGVTVIALLGVIVLRGGNKKRGGPPGPPPGMPPAGGGYGPPGGGYVPPPGGGGYVPPPAGYAPAPAPAAAPLPGAPSYGLTGDQPAHRPAPVNPYGGGAAARATLQGPSGTYTITPGAEARIGRDAAQCTIVLGEPRVSGVHASLKLEGGQLFVRDEHSNNGTLLNGSRINPGAWSPVPGGSLIRLGPVEFSARLE